VNTELLPALPEPAAHVRWHVQNGFDVTEFSGLQKHPEIEVFWGNRKQLAVYTASDMRAYATAAVSADRERRATMKEGE
jgi:hypothetical protein